MTTDPTVPGSQPLGPKPATPAKGVKPRTTRAGMAWVATAVGLVLLILLIAFILQNQDMVTLRYFGLAGTVSLGVALFIGAVGGGVLVAVAGAARIIQLRAIARRARRVPD
ncbi:LapA family protein [Pseudarthrobacter sp. N5]|uniref:LapA family protein n=1 Tax=Pseudarthrobacter sp. N5 TaxID=3418416 RepID=UPI003CF03E6B